MNACTVSGILNLCGISTLLKKFTSKVDGFTFVHFCLKVITSDVKVLYDLQMLYVRTRKVLPSDRGCMILKPSGKSSFNEHPVPPAHQHCTIEKF